MPWKRTTVGSKCVRVPGECITSRARRAARLPAPTEGAGRADPPSSEALDDGVGELAATDHLAVSLAGSIERGDCRSQLRGEAYLKTPWALGSKNPKLRSRPLKKLRRAKYAPPWCPRSQARDGASQHSNPTGAGYAPRPAGRG